MKGLNPLKLYPIISRHILLIRNQIDHFLCFFTSKMKITDPKSAPSPQIIYNTLDIFEEHQDDEAELGNGFGAEFPYRNREFLLIIKTPFGDEYITEVSVFVPTNLIKPERFLSVTNSQFHTIVLSDSLRHSFCIITIADAAYPPHAKLNHIKMSIKCNRQIILK